jgi:hypothetical protein
MDYGRSGERHRATCRNRRFHPSKATSWIVVAWTTCETDENTARPGRRVLGERRWRCGRRPDRRPCRFPTGCRCRGESLMHRGLTATVPLAAVASRRQRPCAAQRRHSASQAAARQTSSRPLPARAPNASAQFLRTVRVRPQLSRYRCMRTGALCVGCKGALQIGRRQIVISESLWISTLAWRDRFAKWVGVLNRDVRLARVAARLPARFA